MYFVMSSARVSTRATGGLPAVSIVVSSSGLPYIQDAKKSNMVKPANELRMRLQTGIQTAHEDFLISWG